MTQFTLTQDNSEEILNQIAQFKNDEGTAASCPLPLIGCSWGTLSKRELPEVEKIIFGLMRGNVGVMCAVTNLGKTTLALNIALTMAAGRTFSPFVTKQKARRVMIVDGESTQFELKKDIETMMDSWVPPGQDALVNDNLFLLCDEQIGDEPLNLSEPEHRAAITEGASTSKLELIIIDTLSALFTLKNENDNAEIQKRVMQPLKKLARDANAVVLLLHHVGKQNEDGQTSVGAYLGRGGSNIGALARVVALLKADKSDPSRVVFPCRRPKGIVCPRC